MADPQPTAHDLRDEALAWRARATELERKCKEQEIEIQQLNERIRALAIENVRLINKKGSFDEADELLGAEQPLQY